MDRLKDCICKKGHGSIAMENQLIELKKAGLPVVIFGGGSGAKAMEKFLNQNDIDVAAFCESSYYYRQGKTVNGKPVYEYENLPQKYSPCNMVLAASGNSIRELIEKPIEAVKGLYVFDITKPLFFMSAEWVSEHIEELEDTYQLLEDDESREVFLAFIEDRSHCVAKPVGPLWRLWTSDQYFNDLYDPEEHICNTLVDCGAWVGDAAEQFLDFLKRHKRTGTVYSFEPDPDNFKKLMLNAQRVGNIQCFPYAVGDRRKKVYFETGNGSQSRCSETHWGTEVQMVSIDEMLGDKRISMVKMDLEGGEMAALRGMRRIILEQSPVLAVCVYHKVDDLIIIPQYLAGLKNETSGGMKKYKFYLRHHSCTSYELVMYAIPE